MVGISKSVWIPFRLRSISCVHDISRTFRFKYLKFGMWVIDVLNTIYKSFSANRFVCFWIRSNKKKRNSYNYVLRNSVVFAPVHFFHDLSDETYKKAAFFIFNFHLTTQLLISIYSVSAGTFQTALNPSSKFHNYIPIQTNLRPQAVNT